MAERLCVAYPLIAQFLTSKELGPLILTNKSWNMTLASNLYEIHFNGSENTHESALQSFIDFFRRATIIHLSNITIHSHCIDISRFSVIQMSKSGFEANQLVLPLINLKHLRCGQCCETVLQNESLTGFVIQFTALISLRLIEAYYLSDRNLEMILSCCTSLTSLYVSSAFHLVAPNCTLGQNLKSLSLTKCPMCRFSSDVSLVDNNLRHFPPCLTSLDLSFTVVTNSSLSTILACSQKLCSLTLVQCMHLFGHITITSKTLTEFSLRQCAAITTLDIDCNNLQVLDLSLCSRLRRLYLTSCVLPTLNLRMLQALQQTDLKCSKLKALDLSGCGLLFRDTSTGSLLHSDHVLSSQCDAFIQEGISPYLAQQIVTLQENNPKLDMSKLLAHHAGGTVLFEQRMVLLSVLAHIKLPRQNSSRISYQRKISTGINARNATIRTKSL